MAKILTVVILVALVVGGYFYFRNDRNESNGTQTQFYNSDQEQQTNNLQETMNDEPEVAATAVAVIETNKGSFEVTLDGEAAPKTVANFMKLAEEGFYEGLNFHRIVRGFVIQGGDPDGDGTGGPGYTVPAEIKLKHTKGAIAMARTGDAVNPTKASSGSQFYIALQDLAQLDGEYTVFGYVTSGMDVVEAIGNTPTEPNPATGETSIPLMPVTINKVTIK